MDTLVATCSMDGPPATRREGKGFKQGKLLDSQPERLRKGGGGLR